MHDYRACVATFESMLNARLRGDAGQPFVTFYDDDTGERTELSFTSWANWVAKTAGVLTEDLDLVPGDTLGIDLPPHWLGTVFCGAAWLAGVQVLTGAGATARVGTTAGDLVCSLHPFALAFPPGAAPAGGQDFGHLWPNQPDVFLGERPLPGVPVFDGLGIDDLTAVGSSDRVLTEIDPTSHQGVRLLLDLLAGTGSMVLVANAAPGSAEARRTTERVTATR